MQSRTSRTWYWSGALAALAALLAGCESKQAVPRVSASEPPAVQAPLLEVKAEPFTSTVAITGTLISTTRVDVKAQTTGKMERFPKEEGDRVEAGEPVVWVEDISFKLALGQAEAAVKVAEAALERARILAGHSRSELQRAQNLLKSGGITDKDLKAAQLADQDAQAQTSLAEAQLQQARAAVDIARKHVQDTVIRAPVSGEIQRKHINPGAYVENATPVFTLVDNRKLELESFVASADLAPIRSGQKVTFTVNSYPGAVFTGQVIEVSPAVETDTRAARVRIRVENSSGRLKTGMFATGEILTGVQSRAIVVPAAAVYQTTGTEAHVFVVENGKAVRRIVRLGRERDSVVEIAEGLGEGDILIAEQSIELAEGVRVEPRK